MSNRPSVFTMKKGCQNGTKRSNADIISQYKI